LLRNLVGDFSESAMVKALRITCEVTLDALLHQEPTKSDKRNERQSKSPEKKHCPTSQSQKQRNACCSSQADNGLLISLTLEFKNIWILVLNSASTVALLTVSWTTHVRRLSRVSLKLLVRSVLRVSRAPLILLIRRKVARHSAHVSLRSRCKPL